MNDFVGNKLNIGDKVVAYAHTKSYQDMFLSEVVGFTGRMVKIQNEDSAKIVSRAPYNLVKVIKER